MRTERVALDMDKAALYIARYAAQAANLSLSDWLSKVARAEGMSQSMAAYAENYRLHPDEPPGWAEYRDEQMFRDDDA